MQWMSVALTFAEFRVRTPGLGEVNGHRPPRFPRLIRAIALAGLLASAPVAADPPPLGVVHTVGYITSGPFMRQGLIILVGAGHKIAITVTVPKTGVGNGLAIRILQSRYLQRVLRRHRRMAAVRI